ncbi:MAG: hypothetical protein COB66_05240 [Coxiella sp. (in: Bacteria)]|nr:MAG: hypothetical protein COB66_05240 [Coxiella sp. (in: g-proteobacteria)]
MKVKHKNRHREGSMIFQTRTWFLLRGLTEARKTERYTYFDYCGRHALKMRQTDYGACRIVFAEWVTDELLECDRVVFAANEVSVRSRAGLRKLVPEWALVFDRRTADMRKRTWYLKEHIACEIERADREIANYQKWCAEMEPETVFGV